MKVLVFIFSFVAAFAHSNNCEKDLGLFYEVSETINEKTITSERQIWRKKNSVLHVYPDSGISDYWMPSYQDKVQLIRYYDSESQGIEYQPGEFKQKTGWEGIAYLSTRDQRSQLTLQSESGSGCDVSQSFNSDNGTELKWMANQHYVESFKGGNTIWKLQKVVRAKDKINAEFDRRQKFNTTDFSDIGDNESDPFIRKMINLGFVEHGASGFYDAAGNALQGEHDHHHH